MTHGRQRLEGFRRALNLSVGDLPWGTNTEENTQPHDEETPQVQ
jgi:hypothetical protein